MRILWGASERPSPKPLSSCPRERGRAGNGKIGPAPVRLLPDMASFTTGSNNMPDRVYENSPQFIEFLANVFKETGVKPEIEVFDTGMVNNALYLRSKALLADPLHFNFVMGVPGSQRGWCETFCSWPKPSRPAQPGRCRASAAARFPWLRRQSSWAAMCGWGWRTACFCRTDPWPQTLLWSKKPPPSRERWGRGIADPSEARRILSL